MQRRMTISIDEAVYEALVRVVGRRKISRFLERMADQIISADKTRLKGLPGKPDREAMKAVERAIRIQSGISL